MLIIVSTVLGYIKDMQCTCPHTCAYILFVYMYEPVEQMSCHWHGQSSCDWFPVEMDPPLYSHRNAMPRRVANCSKHIVYMYFNNTQNSLGSSAMLACHWASAYRLSQMEAVTVKYTNELFSPSNSIVDATRCLTTDAAILYEYVHDLH